MDAHPASLKSTSLLCSVGRSTWLLPVSRSVNSIYRRTARPARLAFQIQKAEVSLRIIDLEAAPLNGTLQANTLLDSTGITMPGPFSPDGESIAFYSNWARFPALFWVGKRDGSGLREIES